MEHLPADCDLTLFQYLRLGDLLAVRGCSRALRRRHGPHRPVWELVQPTRASLALALPHLSVAAMRLLHAAYRLTDEELGQYCVFETVCAGGGLARFHWFVCEFAVDAGGTLEPLLTACSHGQLEVAQWLAGRATCEIRAERNRVFHETCAHGQLAVAQWLADRFALTVADAREHPCRTFSMACANGHLATAQWLETRFGLSLCDALADRHRALRGACAHGHLAVVEWLARRFSLTERVVPARHLRWALDLACSDGHQAVAEWVIDTFGLMASVASRSGIHEAVRWLCAACHYGRPELAQWLITRFELPKIPVHRLVALACRRGHLGIAQWLTRIAADAWCVPLTAELGAWSDAISAAGVLPNPATFQWMVGSSQALITEGGSRCYAHATAPRISELLSRICAAGRLQNAQYLLEHYGPTKLVEIALHNDPHTPLYLACAHGHFEVALWLVEWFPFTAGAGADTAARVLRHPCARGDFPMVLWLAWRFTLTTNDVRIENNAAFRHACRHGHVKLAQWLADRFELTTEDARAANNFALRSACGNGHIATAQWLVEHFELEAADARARANYALHYACTNGHLGVVQWLMARFELTIMDLHARKGEALKTPYTRVRRWLAHQYRSSE
jgi:ankyrin repeat protein